MHFFVGRRRLGFCEIKSIIATFVNQFYVHRREAYRVRRMYLNESETSAGAKHTSEP